MQLREQKNVTDPSLETADELMAKHMPKQALNVYLKSMLKESGNMKYLRKRTESLKNIIKQLNISKPLKSLRHLITRFILNLA